MKIITFLFLIISTQTAQAKDLKLLVWNVFMLPKPINFSMQKTRTRMIASELKKTDYDFLVLQEAFIKNFRDSVKSELKANYPFSYYLGRPTFSPHILGSGVLLLSKYPFKLLDQVYFKTCASADCGAAKGSFLVEATLPSGKVVQLAGTHLQAIPKYGRLRLIQLKQIKKMLKKFEREGVPQFLMGDLNIDIHEPEFNRGKEIIGMEHVPLDGPIDYTSSVTNPCYRTSGDGITHKWLDHIWAKGFDARSASMQVVEMKFEWKGKSCYLSDHHALEAQFQL